MLAARKTYLITARGRKNKRTARMLASARKDHSIPLVCNTTYLCFLRVFIFFLSVEPSNSTGKILRRLRSFQVKIRPHCLGRSWNPPTERPERQLQS